MRDGPGPKGKARKQMAIALVIAACAGIGFGGVKLLYAQSLIKPLLPGPGGSACFTGTFAGQKVDIADWAKGKRVPTGRTLPDGQPEMRIEFERTSDVPLTALTLRLDYDDRKADYDWIFNFTLLANAGPLGRLHARGECPWYDKRRVDPQDGSANVPNTLMLGCGIDCDGGSMSLSRAVGADAVELEFADYGMLMKLGCGGGGRIRVYPARSDAGSFRLERVAPSRCEALKNLP